MRIYQSSTSLILSIALLGTGVLLGSERAIGQPASTSQPVSISKPQQLLTQAKSHFRKAEFKQAIGLYNAILTNPTSDVPTKIEALIGLSEIDLWVSSTQPAKEKLEKALKLSRGINDRAHESEALAGLGWVARS